MKRLVKKILQRKLMLAAAGVIIGVAGYYGYAKLTGTGGALLYVTAAAEKGTLVVSVTGNGQVSASNQIDLKPKASGEIVFIGVENGQTVRAGALIAQLDARDAEKQVRDAEANFQSAALALEKLKKPADALALTQAQNALAQAGDSKESAERDLKKAYDDGFNYAANAFLDLPTIMTGLQDILFGTTLSGGVGGQSNLSYYADTVKSYDSRVLQYKEDANAAYQKARQQYDQNFQDYKSGSRSSATSTIAALIDQTHDTTQAAAEAVKSASNLIQFYEDRLVERTLKPNPLADIQLAALTGYTGKTNTHLLNLSGIQTSIRNDGVAIASADRAIKEKTESLAKLKAGADALDIQTQEIALAQRKNALLDAKEKLADYFLRAPFDSIVAKINIKKSDQANVGVAIATLVTARQLAESSLNEVDVAKVKVGEKATLTFDAIEGLSIAGHVAEIDTVGTVTQGVVTYNVKIALDTQDGRIKPGMSVSAAIITDVEQQVLLVPNAAVKSRGALHYVEILEGSGNHQPSGAGGVASAVPPREQPVEIGMANDTSTIITNGLNEGEYIVVRTINPSAPSAASTQTNGLRLFGGGGGGSRGGR